MTLTLLNRVEFHITRETLQHPQEAGNILSHELSQIFFCSIDMIRLARLFASDFIVGIDAAFTPIFLGCHLLLRLASPILAEHLQYLLALPNQSILMTLSSSRTAPECPLV